MGRISQKCRTNHPQGQNLVKVMHERSFRAESGIVARTPLCRHRSHYVLELFLVCVCVCVRPRACVSVSVCVCRVALFIYSCYSCSLFNCGLILILPNCCEELVKCGEKVRVLWVGVVDKPVSSNCDSMTNIPTPAVGVGTDCSQHRPGGGPRLAYQLAMRTICNYTRAVNKRHAGRLRPGMEFHMGRWYIFSFNQILS